MITIDDVEYTEEELTEEARGRVERIQDLRRRISALMVEYEELQAAISHHAGKIKESVEPLEEENASEHS
jgi:cell fate (sporulation/competence/biofilm development) regulator YlbF (YheA/YmcA/DUF963 family)